MDQLVKEDNRQQYLVFQISDEEFAIEVFKVKEVINDTEVTEIPNTSPYVKGVISRRGVIIPILDLRKYLGFADCQPQRKTRIIIIGHKQSMAGLPVDSVMETESVPSDKITPVPQFVKREKAEFLKEVIEHNNRFISVLKTTLLLERLKI
ncbi:MAG: purine-binding chemotaxis protein CheW [Nitrospirae bacterium]|nr:purine-binding chemotaxis protein CheW [Nitrospirota bacterium]